MRGKESSVDASTLFRVGAPLKADSVEHQPETPSLLSGQTSGHSRILLRRLEKIRRRMVSSIVLLVFAGVAELADAADSKSAAGHPAWGFNSPLQHQLLNARTWNDERISYREFFAVSGGRYENCHQLRVGRKQLPPPPLFPRCLPRCARRTRTPFRTAKVENRLPG